MTGSPDVPRIVDPRVLREVLGHFASGVTVVTADTDDGPAGFARSGADKFAGVDWRPGPFGSPVLDGVSAWIECALWNEYDGGDHTIVVGAVRDLGARPDRLPLLYYRGRYGLTADPGDQH